VRVCVCVCVRVCMFVWAGSVTRQELVLCLSTVDRKTGWAGRQCLLPPLRARTFEGSPFIYASAASGFHWWLGVTVGLGSVKWRFALCRKVPVLASQQ